MQRRLVQATATAIIFASMAMPALASNGKANGKLHVSLEGRHDNGLHLGWFKNGKLGTQVAAEQKTSIALCLETARKAHDLAIKAAAKTFRTAQADARSAYNTAVKTAQKTHKTAIKDARVAFKASAKDQAAIDAYAAAKLKAGTDYTTAMKAAKDAFNAAKVASEKAWKEAKKKADADFKAAKLACAPAPAPTPTPGTDATAPAAVSLTLSAATASAITVAWTAPGDDGSTGTAASYDLRYSTSAITEANWASATQVTGEPTPLVAGSAQSMVVSGLSANTTYHFAMKSQDEVPNVSVLSNVPSLSTSLLADTAAPDAITSLSLGGATATSLVVSWTSTGDDGATGTAASCDLRHSASAVTEANWASATQVTGEPTPLVAGSAQTMTVTGLTAATTYHFAMKCQDEASNVSALSNVPSLATIAADTTAPAAITTLSLSGATSSSIMLTWIATGDDGIVGTAASYDVRYSTSPITTQAEFNAAASATGEPSPAVAGLTQSMTVSGLTAATTYYFAIEATDEASNTSSLSNVPSLLTL